MRRKAALAAGAAALLAAAVWARGHYERDLSAAASRAAQGSAIAATRCGPIEYQEAGEGAPLLVVHGSGGGHDQGMAFARGLASQGIRVIAVSRFGYLGTPMPDDASPEAQADAHACLLDALAIERAAVAGMSAGAPSALQTALRHPARVSALALVVPIAWKPGDEAGSASPLSVLSDENLLRVLGSDFLFWSALHLAREQVFRYVLATPPEAVAAASREERERVEALADAVLPVSRRAEGLGSDTGLGRRLRPAPLETVRVPTLVVSARDDGFGTWAAAQHLASRIPGAKFVGFERGGHLLVGHQESVSAEIAELVKRAK